MTTSEDPTPVPNNLVPRNGRNTRAPSKEDDVWNDQTSRIARKNMVVRNVLIVEMTRTLRRWFQVVQSGGNFFVRQSG